MLAFVHLVALGEGLMLGKRAGVDLAKVFHGISASSGNSFVHETEGQVETIFARARQAYGDRAWSTQVVKLLEDAVGTDVRAPGFPASLVA